MGKHHSRRITVGQADDQCPEKQAQRSGESRNKYRDDSKKGW
jgi:hypothetical protein